MDQPPQLVSRVNKFDGTLAYKYRWHFVPGYFSLTPRLLTL